MAESSKSPAEADHVDIRDRAIRLFKYLRELTELRTKTVRDLSQYEKVLWFSEIPQQAGCHCIAWRRVEDEESSEVWVQVKKPRLKSPPVVPEKLKGWLDPKDVHDSSIEFPPLRDRIIVDRKPATGNDSNDAEVVFKTLAEAPEIRPLWEQYVERQWWAWAEQDRDLQVVQDIYTDLFSIYQRQQKLGEAYEVVLGLGYLSWRTPSGHEIRRHITTAQTSLTFDSVSGVITVGPAGQGAKPTLEQDMLDPQDRPAPDRLNAIETQITEMADSIWGGVRAKAALSAWINEASSVGKFEDTLLPQTEANEKPTIHFAPALILRRRTERSLLKIFKDIIEQLSSGAQPVPTGVMRLVTIVDDTGGSRGEEDTQADPLEGVKAPGEVHFPLPANEEQLRIVQQLSTRQGVLVQGPPGTGKSHTIANLICHLLADGQRVLITSHTARALRVLREKIPKEVTDLCVILLGDDLEALQALEDSVRGITDNFNRWNAHWSRLQVSKLESALNEARKEQARILAQLRALRESETYSHPPRFGGYQGTVQQIAMRISGGKEQYGWLSARPGEDTLPPLSNHDAKELLRLLVEIDPNQEAELGLLTVDVETLPSPAEFVALVERERVAISRYEAASAYRADSRYNLLASSPRAQRVQIIQDLSNLLKKLETLERRVQQWAKSALMQILSGKDRAWREVLTTTKESLGELKDKHRRASARNISGLVGSDRGAVRIHAEALLAHLQGGKGLGIGPFRPKLVRECKYLIREIKVDGVLCDNVQTLQNLLEWMDVADRIDSLRKIWSIYTAVPTGPFITQVAEYSDLCDPLEGAFELRAMADTISRNLNQIQGLREPPWHEPEEIRALQVVAEATASEEDLREARGPLEELAKHLRNVSFDPKTHPSVKLALSAVEKRDGEKFGQAYHSLRKIKESRERLEYRRSLFGRLQAAAPAVSRTLLSTFHDPIWQNRTGEFESAWDWARCNEWITRLSDPNNAQHLRNALTDNRSRISEVTKTLAAEKAWRHCFRPDRMTEYVRQHLMAWAQAMRRVGKGTGKYASLHRAAARQHMEECRSAIPAWIMPIYRVAESVRPGIDAFDVVIVDEASQSGPEALFLQYLAKKILVVGDDKQISPEFVGITRQDVELLRQRNISDLPHSDALGVENSFFDQAQIRYGGQIRLREHFRCMPEIIQFSNNLCYRSEPLIPLRQYGTGRLEPVVTRHVREGFQKGESPRITNPTEAEEIAAEIERCCSNPKYAGKTMGVISLLGSDQARLIERLLLDRIGPEEMDKRQLICGDAYAFQGDERDVIFLSLVSAPSEDQRIGVLSSEKDKRRFNVAASRAKDQMWLFHTATLSDLSPHCLRYSLLEYCLNPQVQPSGPTGISLPELEEIARTVDRSRINPPSPFDSWFEVDVFLSIARRGYQVIPQYQLAGYFIDLLVEGMKGRLAVECYGDYWHGPERYEQDAARQRMLERCGLTFSTVWGSTFYRDREGALESIWRALERLGIHPANCKPESPAQVSTELSETPATKESVGEEAPDSRLPFSSRKPGKSFRLGFDEAEGLAFDKEDKENSADSAESFGTLDVTISPDEESQISVRRKSSFTSGLHPVEAEPYRNWQARPLPDPRLSSIDEVVPGLVEIIAAEGPMPCHRAYRIYARAAGVSRVGRQIRSVFNRAIRKAERQGLIEEQNEHGTRDQINQVVHKKGSPRFAVRTRGNRLFHEIPPSEIGAVMSSLHQLNGAPNTDVLYRAVLEHYEISHMTQQIREILSAIKARYLDKGSLT